MNDETNVPKIALSYLKRRAIATNPGPPHEKGPPPKPTIFAWRKTIFCQAEHEVLLAALEECAKEIGCFVFRGEPCSSDITAIPAFVIIVDRDYVGDEEWGDFVEFCDEVYDDVPCLIVDDRHDLPLPKTPYAAFFDLDRDDAIPQIIRTIKHLKKEMDKNLPDVFK